MSAQYTEKELSSSNRSRNRNITWSRSGALSASDHRHLQDNAHETYSSYGSINSRRALNSPISYMPGRSMSSTSTASNFSSINYHPGPQWDHLEEEDEDSTSSSDESGTDVSVLDLPPQVCCSCIRITPKRFKTAAKFRKFPHSLSLCLVYVMFFLLGIAEQGSFLVLFYSLNAYHNLNPPKTVGVHLFILAVVHLLYPVMGFIADTYFGRYKVMLVCLHISFIGSTILAIAFLVIDPFFDANSHSSIDALWGLDTVIVLSVGYMFVTAGLTGIRVNLIPFGVDQIHDASSGELSSYFHWYYWCFRAGNLFSTLGMPFIYIKSALSFVFVAISISIAAIIILLLVFRENLQIFPKTGNPFAHIWKVLRFASKSPKPTLSSAFQRGQRPPPWIDRAMLQYGGRFTVEEVENVKTFFRILLIIVSFFGYFIVYAHIQTTTVFQGFRMQPLGFEECPGMIRRRLGHDIQNTTFSCAYWTIPPTIGFGVCNLLPLLVLIPLFDRFIYTCLSSWKIFSMFGRITIGNLFILVSILMGLGVELYRMHMNLQLLKSDFESSPLTINAIPFHTRSSLVFQVATPVSIILVLPPYFLFAFAEVFASITIIEFIYAQSPASMKGLLLGCLFGVEGLSMGVAGLLIFFHTFATQHSLLKFFANTNRFYTKIATSFCLNEPHKCLDSAVSAFGLFAFIAVLSLILFIVSAVKYKYRRRDADPFLPIWLIPPTKNDNTLQRKLLRACCY